MYLRPSRPATPGPGSPRVKERWPGKLGSFVVHSALQRLQAVFDLEVIMSFGGPGIAKDLVDVFGGASPTIETVDPVGHPIQLRKEVVGFADPVAGAYPSGGRRHGLPAGAGFFEPCRELVDLASVQLHLACENLGLLLQELLSAQVPACERTRYGGRFLILDRQSHFFAPEAGSHGCPLALGFLSGRLHLPLQITGSGLEIQQLLLHCTDETVRGFGNPVPMQLVPEVLHGLPERIAK